MTTNPLLLMTALFLFGCIDTTTVGQQTASEPSRETTSELTAMARDKRGNPLVTPGICRRVLIETNSIEDAAETVRRVQTERRVVKYSYGVYRLKNGRYIGAETLDSYFEDPREWVRWHQKEGYSKVEYHIRRYIRNGWIPSTARCTDGSDIAADTGVRIEYARELTTTGGDLLGAIITGVAGALLDSNPANTASSGAVVQDSTTRTYTLVCRERILLEPDSFRDGPSISCSGDISQCEARFEAQLKDQYGYMGKACEIFGSGWTAERIKHN